MLSSSVFLFFQPSGHHPNIFLLLGLLILGIFIIGLIQTSEVVGDWSHLFADMQHDPEEFYKLVEEILAEKQVPNTTTGRTTIKEEGVLSYQRLYLQVSRGDFLFHICAAPWGTGFFFSWWLRREVSIMTKVPFISRFYTPSTAYYKLDTDTMFRTSVQQSVLAAIDRLTEAKGIRGLTELERRPDLRSMVK